MRYFSIPAGSTSSKHGKVKQSDLCLDTLGHQAGGSVALYQCHQGTNQVSPLMHTRNKLMNEIDLLQIIIKLTVLVVATLEKLPNRIPASISSLCMHCYP